MPSYWYFQYTGANSKLVHFFVGPGSDELRKLIEEKKSGPGNIQPAALIEWYLDNNPTTLLGKESQLIDQGKGWERRYEGGLKALANAYTKLHQRLEAARADYQPPDSNIGDGWAPV